MKTCSAAKRKRGFFAMLRAILGRPVNTLEGPPVRDEEGNLIFSRKHRVEEEATIIRFNQSNLSIVSGFRRGLQLRDIPTASSLKRRSWIGN
jgi:hypothetical protein